MAYIRISWKYSNILYTVYMPHFVYAFVLLLNADFVLTIYSNCEYYFAQQEIEIELAV